MQKFKLVDLMTAGAKPTERGDRDFATKGDKLSIELPSGEQIEAEVLESLGRFSYIMVAGRKRQIHFKE